MDTAEAGERLRLLRDRASDHLGSRPVWRDNLVAFAAARGIDLRDADITVLTGGATLVG